MTKTEAYEQVLQSIANEQVELSHDKIKWQNQDHIRWAKKVLEEYRTTTHEEQQEWLKTVRKTEY